MAGRSTSWKFASLGGVVAAVAAAWTAGWFYVRGVVLDVMDREMAALQASGGEIACPERGVSGFPFRISVSCEKPSLRSADGETAVTLAGLRGVGLVYDPRAVIVEADGPLDLRGPEGARIAATWSSLRASAGRIDDGMRLSLAAADLDLTAALPGLADPLVIRLKRGELHGRPNPGSGMADARLDLDLAGSVAGLDARSGPDRIAAEPLDAAFDATVTRAPLAGEDPRGLFRAWAEEGGEITVRSATLALAGVTFAARGTLKPNRNGRLDGSLTVTAKGLDRPPAPGGPKPALPPLVSAAAAGFLVLGRTVKEGGEIGRTLDLTIRDGRVRLGPAPLGQIPPLF